MTDSPLIREKNRSDPLIVKIRYQLLEEENNQAIMRGIQIIQKTKNKWTERNKLTKLILGFPITKH